MKTKPKAKPLSIGDVVDLKHSWGTVTRLKCRVCTRFVTERPGRVSCPCGAEYDQQGALHEVVSL